MPGDPVNIGFVPLVDCALLAVAQERGCFARQHVDVDLRKAQSWGQVREKLFGGELDLAHLLLTIPLQAALAAKGEPPVSYAFTLSRNGNGLILANSLWNDGVRDSAGLSAWMAARPGRVLRMGVVFPRGTQEYFLRTWLAKGGLEIGPRIALSIIPPQEMTGRLRKGEIDGFCAGEPWSRRAAASKLGRLVAESGGLLPGLGEKVLGARAEWHRDNGPTHARLIRALSEAGEWLADPANLDAAIEIVSSKRYVNTPKSVVEVALRDAHTRELAAREAGATRFTGAAPHAPVRAHARWYLDQMALWGHVDAASAGALDIGSVCLEDFHRSSAGTQNPQTPPAVRLAAGA